MAKKILISFKDKPKEKKLYDEVKSHSDQSAFVKEALEFFLSHTNNISQQTHQITKDIPIEDESDEIMSILG